MLFLMRRACLFLTAVAFLCGAIGFASASAAPHIVLNNGLIVVHNETGSNVKVEMLTMGGQTWEGADVAPGQALYTHRCCYAAGTKYRVYVYYGGRWNPNTKNYEGGYAHNIYFAPNLCNRNGIPYGFAELAATHDRVVRLHNGNDCYNGPL